MKLIGYVRVSTEEQAQHGVSLAAQEAKLRQYAELYGHDLVEVIVDAGQSAKTLKRPGLERVLGALTAGMLKASLSLSLTVLPGRFATLGICWKLTSRSTPS